MRLPLFLKRALRIPVQPEPTLAAFSRIESNSVAATFSNISVHTILYGITVHRSHSHNTPHQSLTEKGLVEHIPSAVCLPSAASDMHRPLDQPDPISPSAILGREVKRPRRMEPSVRCQVCRGVGISLNPWIESLTASPQASTRNATLSGSGQNTAVSDSVVEVKIFFFVGMPQPSETKPPTLALSLLLSPSP